MSTLPSMLLWLLATLPPLAALWLLWQLVLRREPGYGYNRALLLLAPVLAAALPLLPRPALPGWPAWLASSPAAPAPAVEPLLAVVAPPGPASAAEWPGWSWLLGLYLAGMAVGLGRLAWQAGRLHWLTRQLPRFKHPGYVLVHTGGRLPTSSFGRMVLWDETTALTPHEAHAVLAHELAHVRQRHTRDVLWLHLWRAVLWPNPFVHLLLPALRLTHELLADRQAAAEAGPARYVPVLAALAARRLLGPAPSSLLHPFTFSFTLTRLAMLKNPAPLRRWKQWLPLPLLAAAGLAVGRSASAQTAPVTTGQRPTQEYLRERWAQVAQKRRLAQHQDSLRGPFAPGTTQQVQISNLDGPGEMQVQVVRISKPASSSTPVTVNPHPAVYTYVEQMPQLPGGGGNRALVEAVQRNIVTPPNGNVQGKVFVRFTVQADGLVDDIVIVKSLADTYDQAVVDAVRRLPRLVPGRQGGSPVAVSFTLPVQFATKR